MKKLLYTTRNDLSVPFFDGWQVEYYDTTDGKVPADLVYFRDPFNDPDYQPNSARIDQIISQYHSARIIDQLRSFQDILDHEDKYKQSQLYQDLYPNTWLPSQHEFVVGSNIAKPRISQRAKNILFDLNGQQIDDQWIIQELFDINEELRVYVVAGEILPIASIKSSKANGPVKVIGTRALTHQEVDFVREVMKKCPLDIAGLDIAILRDGKLRLIEANRSPQFKRYIELTGVNIVDKIAQNCSIM